MLRPLPRLSWPRWPLVVVTALAMFVVLDRAARADDEPEQPAADEPTRPAPTEPATDEPTAPAAVDDPADDTPAPAGTTAAGDAAGDTAGDTAGESADPYAGDAIPARLEYDADGDGTVEPAERELAAEYTAAYEHIPREVTPKAAGEIDLANPGMTAAEFQNLVRLAKAKVLDRLQAKMARKQDARMASIGRYIAYFSLSGLLLLFLPLGLRRKYPGKTAMLFKYSGLAAVTFVLTVNFFGGVVLGMRSAQGALGAMTNPQLKVAEGFFDSLAADPDKYLPFAKDLFGPTMYQLQAGGEAEQPAVTLIENGQKLIKDAKVFTTVAHAFKKIDFVFAALPIVLLFVTLALFVLAIRPTLTEIVKMPGLVAAGDRTAGTTAVKNAGRRVVGEVLATLCTVGVLVVLSLIATVVLGRLLHPALDLLIQYFATGVLYLQMKAGASSGLVFVMLFSVIVFLALNLAAIILAMAFFLGKAQRIFQQRFVDRVPLRTHGWFWRWGVPAVLGAMLVPLLYMLVAKVGVEKLSDAFIGGGEDIGWTKLMLVGPMLLVVGFVLVFWAARGMKALKFLATYQVKPPAKPAGRFSLGAPVPAPGPAPGLGDPALRPSSPALPRHDPPAP